MGAGGGGFDLQPFQFGLQPLQLLPTAFFFFIERGQFLPCFGQRTFGALQRLAGALAGGLGMALFDVVGGWLLWAPFTLVIVGLMGYSVGAICENRRSTAAYAVALTVACLIKVFGYYAAEGLIYGNWIAPLTSIPGNLVQIGVASAVVLPVVSKLRKHVGVFSLAESRK